MSRSFFLIPIYKNSSIFINNNIFIINKNIKLNLIKINNSNKFINSLYIKNLYIYNISLNKNYNFLKIYETLYNNLLDKFIKILKNNNFPILIEGIPCNFYENEINIRCLLNNFKLIEITNSKILIELILFYKIKNNLIKIKNNIQEIIFIFNTIYNKKISGFIIINFIEYKNKNSLEIYKNIEKFLFEKNIKIFEYIPIFFLKFEEYLINIINSVKAISFNLYKYNTLIKKIIFFNKNNFKKKFLNFKEKSLLILFLSDIKNNLFYFLYIFNNKNNLYLLLINDLLYEYNFIIKYIKSYKIKIPVFITNKNLSEIIFILKNMNKNLYKYNYSIINKNSKLDWLFNNSNNKKVKESFVNKLSPIAFKKYILDLSKSSINKKILFHEWSDERILRSASFCQTEKIAECYILGDPDKIYKKIKNSFIKFNKNITIINPNEVKDFYLDRLMLIRKHKNITIEEASLQVLDGMTLSTLILENNFVNGIVAGSINTTSNTLKPAFQIIKTDIKDSLVSSLFILLLKNKVLLYGDCAININPNDKQLSNIVIQSYNFAKKIGINPKIAMLSYSTYNSSFGESVDKIISAKKMILEKYPEIIIDGPIQYDSAISNKVSLLKSPNSILNGDANIFIFPNLDSGNITYKAVQRTNKITAIGPILQGLKKPVNDLSRGSSIDDIIYTVAVTVIQSNFK